jgi:hypothetical protein
MYAYVVAARQRMSGVDRFDLPGFASPPARLTSRPSAGKVLCKIFFVRSERRQLPAIGLISFIFHRIDASRFVCQIVSQIFEDRFNELEGKRRLRT